MKDILERLIELQDADIKIVACQKEEEKLPRDIELREAKLRDMEGQAGVAREEAERIRAQVSEINKQLEETSQLVRKGQARLLLVKTQRENQAVTREAEFARKRKGELELQLKEAQAERDTADASLKDLSDRIESERALFEEEKAKASQRLAALKKEHIALAKKREAAAPLLDAEIRVEYERIFRRYRGQAVVTVVKGVCKGCFMTVPPQLYNQVLVRDRVHSCPNCGRILYVEAS